MQIKRSLAAGAAVAAALMAPGVGWADMFIGFGQPGPAGWNAQLYPSWVRPQGGSATSSAFVELSYFTPTGFTGTARDRHQFWAAAAVGRAKPAAGSDDNAWGVAGQQLAYEYYFQVVDPGKDGGLTWWTTPYVSLSFPNGSSKGSGFGAGGNQYGYGFGWNNFVGIGKWSITAAPVLLSYAQRNRHATLQDDGNATREKAGLSLTLANVAIGYEVTPDLKLGLHHAYSIYNHSNSDFARAEQGKIGPAMSYSGWMKPYNVYFAANVNFDYHTSANLKRSTSVTATIIKFF